MILKNQALKNNDQITALDFYIKEMNTYKKEAKGFDKVILWFEFLASYFGTKAYLPMVWILFINALFVCWFAYKYSFEISDISTYFTYFTQSLNPTNTMRDIYGISNIGFWEFGNLLKNILFGALIYETIKSFRKYSRKI